MTDGHEGSDLVSMDLMAERQARRRQREGLATWNGAGDGGRSAGEAALVLPSEPPPPPPPEDDSDLPAASGTELAPADGGRAQPDAPAGAGFWFCLALALVMVLCGLWLIFTRNGRGGHGGSSR